LAILSICDFPEIVIGSFEVVNEAKLKSARDRYFFHGCFLMSIKYKVNL
jgi:hypothetical protein